jgi:hypothetical protein
MVRTVHLKMVKIVNFMLCVFYHNLNKNHWWRGSDIEGKYFLPWVPKKNSLAWEKKKKVGEHERETVMGSRERTLYQALKEWAKTFTDFREKELGPHFLDEVMRMERILKGKKYGYVLSLGYSSLSLTKILRS